MIKTNKVFANIVWTASGKVRSVTRTTGLNDYDLHFKYDPTCNRIVKMVENPENNSTSLAFYTKTYYLRDAQGNIMATYERKYLATDPEVLMTFSLNERSVYGSSRIANFSEPILLVSFDETTDSDYVHYGSPQILSHTNGYKHFELTNHLGNVMAVVSDKRTPIIIGSEITGYTPELLIAKDYYPFGMEMSGRYSLTDPESLDVGYRFGFNGKEKDDEWNGQTGSTYDFGARLYDARIGRWMACDPKAAQMPFISPYSFSYNCPTIFEDPDGEKPRVTVSKSADGGTITITITNKFYVVSKRKNVAIPDVVKLNEVLKGGSYNVDGITYIVNIENEIIDASNESKAIRAILNDDMVGTIVHLYNKGKSYYNYNVNNGLDYIRLNTSDPIFEYVLGHEGGHGMGYCDKYINAAGISHVFYYFINSLMGDVSPLNDFEIQILGSDVMNQVDEQGGINNGETIELNEGKGVYAVDKDKDDLPQGETIRTVVYGSSYKVSQGVTRITPKGTGTAKGKVESPPESKPRYSE